MKVTIESISSVEKKLNFEIPTERVGEEVEKMYRSLQQTATIKGFRAGKAPRALIERQFGEHVAAEAGAHLIEESYSQAVDEHKLPIITRPRVVAEKLIVGQPFRYSATVEIRPEVSILNYEGIKAEKGVEKVKEKEVEETLHRIAESFAQLHPIEGREQIEDGDVVRLDFSASINGKSAPGLQGQGRLIEMGKESIFPGFQSQLLGVKKGETKEFSLPLPQNETEGGEPALDRMATFRITIYELLRKELPQLDDEFAKDHGECETLAELREKVRQNIQQSLDRRSEAQLEEAILAQLVDQNPFEVPPSLIREQERHMLIEAGLLRPEDSIALQQMTLPEKAKEEISSRARRQVQSFLILDALAKQLNILVSAEEIQKRIEEIVNANGVESRQQIEALYQHEENRSNLARRLEQEKTLRSIIEKADVIVVEKSLEGNEADVAGAEEKD